MLKRIANKSIFLSFYLDGRGSGWSILDNEGRVLSSGIGRDVYAADKALSVFNDKKYFHFDRYFISNSRAECLEKISKKIIGFYQILIGISSKRWMKIFPTSRARREILNFRISATANMLLGYDIDCLVNHHKASAICLGYWATKTDLNRLPLRIRSRGFD